MLGSYVFNDQSKIRQMIELLRLKSAGQNGKQQIPQRQEINPIPRLQKLNTLHEVANNMLARVMEISREGNGSGKQLFESGTTLLRKWNHRYQQSLSLVPQPRTTHEEYSEAKYSMRPIDTKT